MNTQPALQDSASFQHDFARLLLSPADDPSTDDAADALRALAAQPAFAIYRNTVMKGCIDALEANFPAVARLVGRDWFRAAAAEHVRAAPPTDPRLVLYGANFPSFLRNFAPAAALPYLPDVAELERLWVEAHVAADALSLTADVLAGLAPDALGALRLAPHPAARWRWCDEHPAHTLWSCNRDADGTVPEELAWHGEGTLLTRPHESVLSCALGAGGCALLDACASGAPLAEAIGAALAAEPDTDLPGLLALLLSQGAFTALQVPQTLHAAHPPQGATA